MVGLLFRRTGAQDAEAAVGSAMKDLAESFYDPVDIVIVHSWEQGQR